MPSLTSALALSAGSAGALVPAVALSKRSKPSRSTVAEEPVPSQCHQGTQQVVATLGPGR